ncbi:hypothetical protein [Arcobacter sp.]|uniref:hypothetical protein n=1 Tax=Arcobacter sp. TaxID=1872629 RepID=UPI003D1521F8
METNKELIKESLKELFTSKEAFITILSGEWGVGKTYFWKEEVSDYITQTDKQVYISLFGLNSIDEIKTNILFNISKFKKSTNWLNKNIVSRFKSLKTVLKLDDNVTIPLNMEIISSLFSLLTEGDFKEIVICFDDIERISSKIDFKDFMGFLSELKEKKKCQVVIILNENELDNLSNIDKKPYSEIFSLYKEKIVDYEFHYKPSVKECFDAVTKELHFDKDIIFDFFNKKEIKNIRVINQCLYHLHKFLFIIELNLDSRIIEKFLQTALATFSFKMIHNLSEKEFEEFKSYKEAKDKYSTLKSISRQSNIKKAEIEDFDKIEKFEKCLKDYESKIYWHKLEKILYNYLYSALINENEIKEFLQNENENTFILDVQEAFKQLDDNYLYQLNLSKENYDSQLIKILEKNKTKLSNILSLDKLNQYIKKLENTNDKNKIILKKEILENYIKNVMDTQDNEKEGIFQRNDVENMLNTYPELKEFVNKHREVYDIYDLNNFFNNLVVENNAYLSRKDEIIIKKYKDEIKDEMISSKEFFRLIILIVNNHSRDSDISILKEILDELKNDEKYRDKIIFLEEEKLI